jgi:hypothetical protein
VQDLNLRPPACKDWSHEESTTYDQWRGTATQRYKYSVTLGLSTFRREPVAIGKVWWWAQNWAHSWAGARPRVVWHGERWIALTPLSTLAKLSIFFFFFFDWDPQGDEIAGSSKGSTRGPDGPVAD